MKEIKPEVKSFLVDIFEKLDGIKNPLIVSLKNDVVFVSLHKLNSLTTISLIKENRRKRDGHTKDCPV